MKEVIKLSLEEKISNVANGKGGKFNLKQYKNHREICKNLYDLSVKNSNYPICYLVYFAVGKNAHRTNVFDIGYKKMDMVKAETILNWLFMFADYNNNPKLFKNSDLAHALCRFYDKVSTETSDFQKVLNAYTKSVKIANFKTLISDLNIG